MIRVEHISHWFGALHVLDDVSFHVPKGEVFGFIGPNGAGKTTTLRMMATLLEPQDGRILIGGYDVAERPADVRQIMGFMPDGFGVYERVTVREYLEFFAAAHGIDASVRASTLDAVMELTNLHTLRDRLVQALSKGMKQRLAIGRTLLHDPEVLILDEPANGLDPRARIEMKELVEELAGMGKTIVLSSHILTELSDMCTSVAILEKGRLRTAGKVEGIGQTLMGARGASGVVERAVRMRFFEPPADLLERLRRGPGVESAERDPDGAVQLRIRGGEEQIAQMVAWSVHEGLKIIRLEPDKNDLERIFMEVTRGEVQ